MYSFEMELGGRKLVIENGKMAKQANGAVLVRYGDGPKGKMVAEIRPLQPGGIPSSH